MTLLYILCDYDVIYAVCTSEEEVSNYWKKHKQDATVLVYKANKNYLDKEAIAYESVYGIHKKFKKSKKK